jgi:hypothetical protein
VVESQAEQDRPLRRPVGDRRAGADHRIVTSAVTA